ncbi:MAG TPA: ABC transporter substrate-binding protein [Alphaproteobacteria bacterium]|nr:ABC transporter substrate-binding protein [Alphaproteobacteria bacterium]
MLKRFALGLVILAAASLASAVGRAAEKEVVIGAIYPLSGPAAQVGVDAKAAIETAADIVNNSYDIDLPLAKTKGLPNLGGAKLRVVFADHQGDPQKGRAEAERLITQEKVSALLGVYHSAVAAVVGQVAERYRVPFMVAESSSPSLTKQGLKWLFRTSPHDVNFSEAMFDFLKALKEKKIADVKTIALFHEDTLFGTDSSNVQKKLAEAAGIKVVADIKYRANSPSLTAEVEQLKAANADVVMPTSYTTDAILMVKTMAELGYHPKAIIAQDAGFVESAFLSAVGSQAEGLISRASFALDLGAKRPSVKAVNDLYRKRSGKDLTDNTARAFTATIVLADAINRAGSTDSEAIRAALQKTDMPGSETIMPWPGVKFDENGQNTLAKPIMMQFIGGKYVTVFPFDVASHDVLWPMPGK